MHMRALGVKLFAACCLGMIAVAPVRAERIVLAGDEATAVFSIYADRLATIWNMYQRCAPKAAQATGDVAWANGRQSFVSWILRFGLGNDASRSIVARLDQGGRAQDPCPPDVASWPPMKVGDVTELIERDFTTVLSSLTLDGPDLPLKPRSFDQFDKILAVVDREAPRDRDYLTCLRLTSASTFLSHWAMLRAAKVKGLLLLARAGFSVEEIQTIAARWVTIDLSDTDATTAKAAVMRETCKTDKRIEVDAAERFSTLQITRTSDQVIAIIAGK